MAVAVRAVASAAAHRTASRQRVDRVLPKAVGVRVAAMAAATVMAQAQVSLITIALPAVRI
jgi:hypothetical protein